nr:hypothetical protein [Tanacetum cinerariifolium]
SQITGKCKAALGYNAIPPPYTRNFMPLKHNFSFSSLKEFVDEPKVNEPKKPVVETSEAKASEDKPKVSEDMPKVIRNSCGPLLIKEWISDSEDEAESRPNIEKKTVKYSFAKIEFVKSNEQVKSPIKTVVKQVLVNTARQVSTAHPKSTLNAARQMTHLSKSAHSSVKRPIHKKTTFINSNVNQKVNIVISKTVNTARPKAVVNVILGHRIQVSDGLGPQKMLIFLPNMQGNPQKDLQEKGVIDNGSSMPMIGNMSYLTDYEEIV